MRAILERLGVRSALKSVDGAARGGQPRIAATRVEAGAQWLDALCRRVSFDTLERALYGAIGLIVLASCVVLFAAQPPSGGGTETIGAPPAVIVATPSGAAPRETPPAPTQKVEPQMTRAAEPQPAPKPAEAATAQPAAPALSLAPLAPPTDDMSRTMAAPAPPQNAPAAEQASAAVDAAQPEAAAVPDEESVEKAPAAAPRDEASVATAGRVSKCFIKVSGRVLHSGSCRISRKGQAVSLQFAGSGVVVSPHRGREWTLTVSGRNVGKVYKASGGCWGARNHTYVCERGV